MPLSLVYRRHEAKQPPPSGQRAPLLILLHGVGSNELSMAAHFAAFDPRFVVLSVRSPIELGTFSYGWFHVRFTPTGREVNTDEARAGWERLPGFIDEAVREHSADPARVYLAGFSQGGIMSLATLLTAPEKVAGAVCMSGRLMPEVLPVAASSERLRGKPVLVVHGVCDDRLGIEHAREAVDTLGRFPLEVDAREFDMAHVMTDESIAFVSAWLTTQLDRKD